MLVHQSQASPGNAVDLTMIRKKLLEEIGVKRIVLLGLSDHIIVAQSRQRSLACGPCLPTPSCYPYWL